MPLGEKLITIFFCLVLLSIAIPAETPDQAVPPLKITAEEQQFAQFLMGIELIDGESGLTLEQKGAWYTKLCAITGISTDAATRRCMQLKLDPEKWSNINEWALNQSRITLQPETEEGASNERRKPKKLHR